MPHLHQHSHHHEGGGLMNHPRAYARVAHLGLFWVYRRVARDAAGLRPADGALVVDVGTGPGRLPVAIAERLPGVRVEGVDPDPKMIEEAAQAARARGSRATFRTAGAEALPYDDGSVALVVSTLSLHHWSDPSAGLREVVRVLTPGGQAWILDLRGVLREAEPLTSGIQVGVARESPVAGTWSINPLGRLVLTKPFDGLR